MAMTTRQRIDVYLTAQGREDAFPNDYLDMIADDAEIAINRFRNVAVIEAEYQSLAGRLAVYWIEKLGYNGAKDISENGISRNYEQGDIPDSILRLITPAAVVI